MERALYNIQGRRRRFVEVLIRRSDYTQIKIHNPKNIPASTQIDVPTNDLVFMEDITLPLDVGHKVVYGEHSDKVLTVVSLFGVCNKDKLIFTANDVSGHYNAGETVVDRYDADRYNIKVDLTVTFKPTEPEVEINIPKKVSLYQRILSTFTGE